MKKFLLSMLLVILCVSFNSVVFAKIDDSRIAIGGIQNGVGEYDSSGTLESWTYGDSFIIEFWNNKAVHVRNFANNDIFTKD